MTPRSVTTLLFHDVVHGGDFDYSGFRSPDANIYKFSANEFSQHLRAISESAIAPISSATDILAAAAPDTCLLLSFDDGGVSALNPTADLLEAFGWRGVFFVTTGQIGRRGFLDAAAIRELVRRGHTVGSHSETHPLRMSACTPDQLRREWLRSTQVLSDILGQEVRTASVPGGYFSRLVAKTAAEAGISCLFNSEPVSHVSSVQGCRVFGRFSIQRGMAPSWTSDLCSGKLRPRIERYLGWNAKKALKKVGGEMWLKSRRAILARRSGASLPEAVVKQDADRSK